MYSRIPMRKDESLAEHVNALRKSELENRFAQLQNQYYGPEKEQTINKLQNENKYAPLEMAIKAQNSLNYSSRTNDISNYLRSISEMPDAIRTNYLSQPENRSFYHNMIQQFQQGISNNDQNKNLISPELLQSSGFSNQQKQNMNKLENIPQQMNQQQMNNVPKQEYQFAETSHQLSQPERSALTDQLSANNKIVGSIPMQRAQGAATMDKWLLDNRSDISKAMYNATRYSGLVGRGKKYLDYLKSEQPESYSDYLYLKDSIRPNLANQIKFMEHMGATNSQLGEAKNMLGAIDSISVKPDTAVNIMNKSIKSLFDLSDAIYKTAEPAHQGVYRKLYDIPKLNEAYISAQNKEEKQKKPNKNYTQLLEKDLIGKINSFTSAKELNNWYKNITDENIKKSVRDLLSNG